jgi:hypothetical protein
MDKIWIWISGWGIYPDQFRNAVELALPEDSHQILAPAPDALEKVLASDADCIGGYSLGSLILLSALEQLPEDVDIICMAPFLAFCREDQLGGTTPQATLKTLQKRLQLQPAKTLQLFYRLAGLSDQLADDLPYPIEHLIWGLEQLANLKADTTCLGRAKAVAGLTDPLINSKEMQSHWPGCYFANNCNHDYRKLLTRI